MSHLTTYHQLTHIPFEDVDNDMIHRLHRTLSRPRPWRHLELDLPDAESHVVRTADGQELVVRRVRPKGEARRTPVMLVHGLGANHLSFHFPQRSVADWLARRGHDVWLPELRGHGASEVDRYDWSMDDYLRHDLPAVIDEILRRTSSTGVNWVGHSMGGVLLLSFGILHPGGPIRRGVTVGSALDYRVGASGFEHLLRLRPVLQKLVAIPYGTLIHLLAPLMGRGPKLLEGFNVWGSNIEPEIVRAIHAHCFHTIPVSLLESLSTTFDDEGLRLESGFRFLDHASRLDFPVRLLAANRDAQVSVDAVRHTSGLVGENADVRIYGADHGQEDHYGHFDLLLGRRASEEVWPDIADWLEREDLGPH